MKTKMIIIAGPTATGKSDAAAEVARRINGEVISADSMQVYKYMTIGTAKPSLEDMRGVPHYLIDEISPDAPYSAAIFQEKARGYIENMAARGKVPILCGGTGFYINALLYGTDFTETVSDEAFREEMLLFAQEKGAEALHAKLVAIDPVASTTMHFNNVRRVIRALEYYAQTGRRISEHNAEQKQREPDYDAQTFILTRDRALLYARIDRRVDIMMERGLEAEVKWLLDAGYHERLPSMQGLGYKEIAGHLRGEYALDEAVRILKRDTRHFAKRQLTWFAHQADETARPVEADDDANQTADRILRALL